MAERIGIDSTLWTIQKSPHSELNVQERDVAFCEELHPVGSQNGPRRVKTGVAWNWPFHRWETAQSKALRSIIFMENETIATGKVLRECSLQSIQYQQLLIFVAINLSHSPLGKFEKSMAAEGQACKVVNWKIDNDHQ